VSQITSVQLSYLPRAANLAIRESFDTDIRKQPQKKAKEEATGDDKNMKETSRRKILFLRLQGLLIILAPIIGGD